MAGELARVYLTRVQHERMGKELERLETVERAKLVVELQSSPPSGMGRSVMDPVREKQALLEGRIARLRSTLAKAQVRDLPVGPITRVQIGAEVHIRDVADGTIQRYLVVGPGGIGAGDDEVSYESPMGQALLDHCVGDTVRVTTPSGILAYRIERIERPDV